MILMLVPGVFIHHSSDIISHDMFALLYNHLCTHILHSFLIL